MVEVEADVLVWALEEVVVVEVNPQKKRKEKAVVIVVDV